MPSATLTVTNLARPTKMQKVFDYLRSGKSLTQAQARQKFRVGNLRALVSHLQDAFEDRGMNYSVERYELLNGRSSYYVRKMNRSEYNV